MSRSAGLTPARARLRAATSPAGYLIVTGLQEVFDLIAGFSAASGHGHNDDVDFVGGWAAVAPAADWTATDSARLQRHLPPE